MNELLLPNIPGSFQQGYAFGNQVKQARKAEANQNMLTGLAPQVIAGNQGAYEQAAAINPEQAAAYQSAGDAQLRRLKGAIAYLDGIQDPAKKDAAYRAEVVPYLSRFGQGKQPPATFAEAEPLMEQARTRIAAMEAAQQAKQQRNLAVSPGSAIVDPDTGQVIYERPFAPANAQIAKVPDGNGGYVDMIFDPKTRQLSEPNYPGVQPTAFVDADGRQATIGADVAPRDRRALLEAGGLGNAGEGAEPSTIDVSLPAIDSTPAQFGGGRMGYTPPKPAGGRDAPSGYQWAPDGSSLLPIPGGPADRKNNPTPADQARNEMQMRKELSDRLKQDRSVLGMYQNLARAASDPSAAGDLSMIFAYMKMLDPGSVVREQEFANAQNAAGVPDQIRNAYNRALNGQRLNTNQRADFLRQAANIAANAQHRITGATREYQGIADQYGYDPTRATGMADFRNVQDGAVGAASEPQNAGGPAVGTVQDGYLFHGGDPANPANWERL